MASPTYWRLFNPAPRSISGAPSRLCIQSLPATDGSAVLADGQQVALINIQNRMSMVLESKSVRYFCSW